jgi:hypothetical protein
LTLGTTCKNLQNTEDARVHYAVLKIRTEPCVKTPRPGGHAAGRSSKRPSKAAASSGPNSVLGVVASTWPSFRSSPRGERTNRVISARKPNSQCSTRKHGRPGERSPPEDAGAP